MVNKQSTALISNLQHFSTGDGPGIRSTVFFQGCTLKCDWCHNPETIPLSPQLLYYANSCKLCGLCVHTCKSGAHQIVDDNGEIRHIVDKSSCCYCGRCANVCPANALTVSGTEMTVDEIYSFIAEDCDFYKSSGGGVTLSGGEPLAQAEFCAAIAERCRENDIHVIIDTSGHVPYTSIQKVLKVTDIFYYDLKAVSDEEFSKRTGGSLKLVKDNLIRLIGDGGNVVVRLPIIPGYNNNAEYCREAADFLLKAGVKALDIIPFHRLGFSKYKALGIGNNCINLKPIEKSDLERLKSVFEDKFRVTVKY